MTVSVDNKAIKIPDQHYVGFNKRGDDEVPLGFMTPDGTDAAAIKRKKTVDDWAQRNYYGANREVKLPASTFPNKPLSGFKFGSSVRHGGGWGQGNVKWRIEDPRGFELEISSPNLQQIMEISTIEKGEILDKCVWGRLGSENILIPIVSNVYQTAVANTARLNSTASLKDLKVGHYLVLQNGIEGRYLGSHYEVSKGNLEITQGSKKKHFIEVITDGKVKYETMAAIKPSSITAGTELTVEDAERIINKELATNDSAAGWKCTRVSCKPIKNNKYVLGTADAADKTTYDDVLVVSFNGRVGYSTKYELKSHSSHRSSSSAVDFDLPKYLADGKVVTSRVIDNSYNSWNRYERARSFDFVETDPAVLWQSVTFEYTAGSGDTVSILL